MKRKPDYVFNVWGSGNVTEEEGKERSAALEAALNAAHEPYWKIRYRIKVYLKEQSK